MNTFLVYSPQNSNVAENISANLEKGSIQIIKHTRRVANQANEQKSLNTHVSSIIILLITDNFLKDKECMYECMKFLKNPELNHRILPVVADGRNENALGGIEYTTTKFERLSNLIHYMNYWQDQYLEMRKAKNTVPIKDSQEFDIIKNISQEIAGFIRLLKEMDYVYFEDLHATKFEALFKKGGWLNTFHSFRNNDMIPFVKEEFEKIEEIDMSSIPGMELLEKATKEPIIEEDTIDILKQVEVIEEVIDTPKEVIDVVKEIPAPIIVEDSPVLDIIIETKETEEVEKIIQEKVKEVLEQPAEVNEKEDFEKEGLSYQDKSSYDLLVSLFEDDKASTNEKENNTENTSFLDDNVDEVIEEKEELVEKIVEEIIEEAIPTIEKVTEIQDDIVEMQDILEEEEIEEELEVVIEKGDTLASAKMLQEIIALEPDNTEARYEYAMLLSDKLQNHSEAITQLETIASQDNTNIESVLRLAELYELEEDYFNAKDSYEKALVINDEYPGLQYSYALLLNNYFKSQKRNAAKHFKIAAEQDNIEALYQYAVMQYEFLGKPKKALKKFQKVIQKDPTHPFANYDVAVLYYELGKPKLAAQYYHDAYLNNPELRTEKNDEAFKVQKYLFAPKEVIIGDAEESIMEEILEEVMIDDITDLSDTYEINKINGLSIENEVEFDTPAIDETSDSYRKIEELLDEDGSFEDLEDTESIVDGEEELVEEIQQIITNDLEVAEENIEEEPLVEEEIEIEEEEEVIIEVIETEDSTALLVSSVVAGAVVTTLVENEEEIVEEVEEEEIHVDEEIEDEEDFIIEKEATTLVLITGATSGIGKATAHLFASKGHSLIITGRRSERLESTKALLETTYGIDVEILEFDVRNLEACKRAIDSLDERLNKVDILINNAGLAKGMAPIHEGDIDHWETMIDTNIKGLLYMTRLVAPGMVANKKGHIINIGSIAGKEVYPNGNVYCATKHAVDALTKGMRIDMHQHNVRVSAIHPGAVEETEFSLVRHDFNADKARKYQDFTPVNSKDIAEIIYFVATRPSHVNIQDLLVTGSQQATATIVDKSGRK
jgi:NADP-dependent 3-hydroxy acid dehydrogenase YdfG/tetratricopeptide (TPR) repeat protein